LADNAFVSTPVEESSTMSIGKRKSFRDRSSTREVGSDNRWMLVAVHHNGKVRTITAQYAVSIDHLIFLDWKNIRSPSGSPDIESLVVIPKKETSVGGD
jgi:hypothetical protein